MTDEEQRVDPVAKGCGLGCFGLVAVLVVFILWSLVAGDGEPDAPNQYEAEAQCEDFIADRLKSPASAEYDLTAVESGGKLEVTGTVDSQNGFGAMVRSDVRCVIRFSGDTAHLDDISLEQR